MELTFTVLCMIAAVHPEVAEQSASAYDSKYHINEKLDRLSRQLTSEQQRNAIGNAAIVAKIVTEHSITLHWEF